MERIPDPSKEALVLPLPCVFRSPGLTVKTNQFEEARNEVRQNLSMRYSLVGSDAHIVSSDSEETDHEIQRRTLKTQLVTGYNSVKSNLNNVWEGVTSGLEEEDRGVNRKKKYAVENDDVSSLSAFESRPLDLRLENEKNATKTIQFEPKVKNPGGEEEDKDGCSEEEMDVSHPDLLSIAGIRSNNASSASNDAEESSVQQSQGVNNRGCEGDNGKEKPLWHLLGGEDLPVGDRDKDKGDDQAFPQEKMDLDILQPDLLNSTSINNNGASSALRDNSKEGCCQAKFEVENTGQCHGPSGGVDSSADSAKFAFSPSDLQHSSYCSKPSCGNTNCNYYGKAEVEHMRTHKTHKEWMQCLRCKLTRAVVKKHAKTCCLTGCRIPHCYSTRKVKADKGNITAKPKTYKAPLVARPLVPEPPMYSKFPQWWPWCNITPFDGKVIFRNTNLMPADYFLENKDYIVDKQVLGKGSNGHVYQVYLLSDKNKKVVVKETTYRIRKEEGEVYKGLGDHEHIVKHLGGTFRGNDGHALIFMELCDDSLYNYMENTLKRRLSVAEAMFYWLQIREAVEYLHNRGIIHKDIKAKNVLMKGRRVLLADFDTAIRLLNEVTEKGLKRRGTKGFVSPEVWDCAPHGRPADIFSMGCFVIEMTIGAPVNETLKEKIEMLRKLDSELAELVVACVSERPEDRPTARSLLDWPVVKRYLAAGKGGRKENVQGQETTATEDQTATLHALEYRAGESNLRRTCESETIDVKEL
ncbi:Serine/threonine-protein kinase Nek4 [Acropora cervicornis]|uniref:Serine/threonine-protein kinase Nek4 n=1 Tax=Acropora cervicornis TaxID=6130 RepID=A0AAD9PTS4_ACRCE|nr:Serine/threonine-protein kinase Nek4 [Acropora cervicornis]